jgi:hypothetical protein
MDTAKLRTGPLKRLNTAYMSNGKYLDGMSIGSMKIRRGCSGACMHSITMRANSTNQKLEQL